MEELVVRKGGAGGYMRLVAGDSGRVAVIAWYRSDGERSAEVYGGSTSGMVLENKDVDGSWTAYCIDEGVAGICP